MWVFHNFFQPVMRLKEKISVTSPDKHHHTLRRFDSARTPLDRLLETDALDDRAKANYLTLRKQTNPLQLRNEIHALIHELLNLSEAPENQIQNVHDTLKVWDNAVISSLTSSIDTIPHLIYSFRKEIALR